MSTHNLDYLFKPQSIALIGASNRPRSVGATVMHNLLAGGFAGPIMPVNPKHKAVAGVLAYPNVAGLPVTPDLAILCVPPCTIPGLINDLVARGARAAVVISAGLDQEKDEQGRTLQEAMVAAAQLGGVRILGPNCVGLMIPGLGVNGSFAHTNPLPGNIAFVTQSGALATVVLDWAKADGIGFSYFVSLGNSADVDFGDVLEYLGNDPATQAILLYIESLTDASKFMAAARAVARHKPIIAVKAGRVAEGAKAAHSHTGALAGADDVFDAALRQAGILRVDTIEDLFNAVETLARTHPLQGERLTIFTNGGGPGVMATDSLVRGGGQLTVLSDATLAQLDAFLPANWSHGNPVDMIGDAPPERYVQTLQTLVQDPGADALLFLHSPSAIVPSDEIARVLAPVIQTAPHNVLTCWLGRDSTAAARGLFAAAGLPIYESPEDGVAAFLQMVHYRRIKAMLIDSLEPAPLGVTPIGAKAQAETMLTAALADGRTQLTEPETKALLAIYGIPTVKTQTAATPAECEWLASDLGLPLVLKIVSPDITHKSDVGGVALDLKTPAAVRAAATAMLERVRGLRPTAQITGFSLQPMIQRPAAYELIVGSVHDPIFGPVILFGQGGTAVEVIGDRAVALPPLNLTLARDLVARTRVAKLLHGYRDRPAVKLCAIYTTLMQVAQMVSDLPQIRELDINPLLADAQGAVALDARVRIG